LVHFKEKKIFDNINEIFDSINDKIPF